MEKAYEGQLLEIAWLYLTEEGTYGSQPLARNSAARVTAFHLKCYWNWKLNAVTRLMQVLSPVTFTKLVH